MNTRPHELKRLLESKGLRKKFLAEKLSVPQSYISHALNPSSLRYKTAKIATVREQLYLILSQTNIAV